MTGSHNKGRRGTKSSSVPEKMGNKLTEYAHENSIAVDEDSDLTNRFSQIAPASEIPEKMYSGVAALLAFLRDAEEAAGE